MTHQEREETRLVELQWRREGRGRGLRWQLLRDLVAACSLRWMTTQEVQDVMMRLRGLSWGKTRELLESLERTGDVHQEQHESRGVWMWGATQTGVSFWLGSTKNIPAGIAQVALTTRSVKE